MIATHHIRSIDLGCGRGFFAIPAAKIVGKEGNVYGVDRNPGFLEELERRAKGEGLTNIHSIVGKAEDTVLCEGCADFVFFGIVLHDFDDPAKVLKNAKRMLKSTGRLIDLDWKKEHMNFSPPYKRRFTEGQSKKLIENAGFFVESIKDTGPITISSQQEKGRNSRSELVLLLSCGCMSIRQGPSCPSVASSMVS